MPSTLNKYKQFTQENKNNCCLAFPNTLVFRNMSTKWYRKPNSTWSSISTSIQNTCTKLHSKTIAANFDEQLTADQSPFINTFTDYIITPTRSRTRAKVSHFVFRLQRFPLHFCLHEITASNLFYSLLTCKLNQLNDSGI